MTYPKRLIEVDLPIKRISAHARREKSIRHGHISTLHIWWARRPLAACRAVICASLWIDPVDELCPQVFRDKAAAILTKFAAKAVSDRSLHDHCSPESLASWKLLTKPEQPFDISNPQHLSILRYWLLDFIADFANWDNSTQPDYLETARALTQVAHEALGGEVGTRPLVVDPFAGGGSIPLEALRVGADAFASDLNPVAVLLNKVVLEYIPKYGQRLADEVRKWGQWVKDEAEKELAEFYPKDEDGSTPIAYLWARTIISEAPDDGSGIPVEVPLMRSLWLAKKTGRNKALRWVRDDRGVVQTEVLEVTYADGITRKVCRPLLEIFEPKSEKEVEKGTLARGSATCPITGYTTLASRVREQFSGRRGGSDSSILLAIYCQSKENRFYRLPNSKDYDVVAKSIIKRRKIEASVNLSKLSAIPDEELPYLRSIFNINLIDVKTWGDLFSARQVIAVSTLSSLTAAVYKQIQNSVDSSDIAIAITTLLALAVDRQADYCTSICTWVQNGEFVGHNFAQGQSLPIKWDFAEVVPLADGSGNWDGALGWIIRVIENLAESKLSIGSIEKVSAFNHVLPNDSVGAVITDPPYYDAIPYADLSDFFYVWLRRTLKGLHSELFVDQLTQKQDEVVQLAERNPQYAYKTKENFEHLMSRSLGEARRIAHPSSIGVFVFAHKETTAWEAMLKSVIDAGWVATASWTIDTERGTRMRSMNSAALASSVHLVCRPRENPDGTLREEIGDWRDVLQQLPKRIKEWMPRLTEQGVVGADAIFACLGPALEIFSRYSSVEKASGEIVPLREYLEYVWAAISKEALSTIFKDADTSNFEEDARLTAMWLWTLSAEPSPSGTNTTDTDKMSVLQEDETDDDDEENTGKKAKITGFSLEYDAARKIAQGLGAHLETLTHLVEVKGDKARLLPVKERAAYLFGKEGITPDIPKKKAKGDKQLTITGILAELPEDEHGEIKISRIGETVCDKVHQAMLLFNSGRSEALKRFLVDEGIGNDTRFWQLAQSFSALYPAGTDEKRWVDGLLARKKGLGL